MNSSRQLDKIIALREGTEDGIKHSFASIASIMGGSKDSIQKLYKRASSTETNPIPVRRLPKPLILSGDIAVVGDVHVPDTSFPLCQKVAQYAADFGIKQLAIVGDLGNFDQFSKYKPLMPNPDLELETKTCGKLLTYWLKTFDQIYWCRGNHDQRSIEFTSGNLNLDLLANMMVPGAQRDKIVTSMYNGMWLRSPKGKYLLAHQKEYSKQKLAVAQRLCEMYGVNIVTHHQHYCAVGMDKTGKYLIADNGCLADPSRIAYKRLNFSTQTEFNQGFAMVVNGHYLPYVEGAPWGLP